MSALKMSASNNPTMFINTVKKFEDRDNAKELSKFHSFVLKSCEEFVNAENLNGLNKILMEIPLMPYPAVYLAVFGAKLQLHAKFNLDELQNMMVRISQLPADLGDVAKDSTLAMFYFPIFKALKDAAISKKCSLLVIKTICEGILWWTGGNPHYLTPAHSALLCCCLKARHFRFCMEFLDVDVNNLLVEGLVERKGNSTLMACGSEAVLLFFYYGSLIYAMHDKYEKALNLMEYLICIRDMAHSAIALEGFKKAVLFGLILGKTSLTFPGSRIVKFLTTHYQVKPYLDLASLVTRAPKSMDIPALIYEFLEKQKSNKNTQFARDCNLGLIDVLMTSLKEQKVIDLPKTFIAVERKQAMARTFIRDPEEFDAIVRKCVVLGRLRCTIDHEKEILNFPQDEDSAEEEDLDELLVNVAQLSGVLRNSANLLKVASAGQSKNKKRTNMI